MISLSKWSTCFAFGISGTLGGNQNVKILLSSLELGLILLHFSRSDYVTIDFYRERARYRYEHEISFHHTTLFHVFKSPPTGLPSISSFILFCKPLHP